MCVRWLTPVFAPRPQKCSTFHLLPAFLGTNRTCKKQLVSQLARRKQRKAGAQGQSTATHSGSPSNRSLSPADVTGLPEASDATATTDGELFSFVNAMLLQNAAAAAAPPPLLSGDAGGAGSRARALAMWAGNELPYDRTVSLKIGGATPGQLPATLAPALASAWCDNAALCMEAAPRPGCTLLHVDCLVRPDAPPAPDAPHLLQDLLDGLAGPWLRQRSVTVRIGGGDAAVAKPGGGITAAPTTAAPPPPLPRLLPLALHTAAAELQLHTRGWAGPPPGCALLLRLYGQVATQRFEGGIVTLPPLDGAAEGAARIWLAQDGAAGGAERTVVLTQDAAIAAEVASLDATGSEATERLLRTLGAALRPGCAPRVLVAAAAEALSRGWVALASRLLPLLRAALDADACDDDARTAARELMHAAALSGRAELVALTLSLSSDGALGTPHSRDRRRVTPMHLAAAMGDGAAAEALAGASPAALVSWFSARSHLGATPADEALAAGGAAARANAALLRRLNSARVLASELAASSSDAAAAEAQPAGDAALQPCDDLAVARFLLRTFAPADPAAPAAPGERALYEAQRFARRRKQALCFPPFAIAVVLPRLLTALPLHPPHALDPAVAPTFHQAFAVYRGVQHLAHIYVVVAINAAVLALAGLPQLRLLYERHGVAVLRIFAVLQFMVLPALVEMHVQRTLGFALIWPPLKGSVYAAARTAHLALLPLPCRDSVALLAARCLQMLLARTTGAPLWQGSVVPWQAVLLATLVHGVLAGAVVAADRRAWAAWRRGRRMRLAERLPLKQA